MAFIVEISTFKATLPRVWHRNITREKMTLEADFFRKKYRASDLQGLAGKRFFSRSLQLILRDPTLTRPSSCRKAIKTRFQTASEAVFYLFFTTKVFDGSLFCRAATISNAHFTRYKKMRKYLKFQRKIPAALRLPGFLGATERSRTINLRIN